MGWYRKYYLLVNVPVLLVALELILPSVDAIDHAPFNNANDLEKALTRLDAAPPGGDPAIVLLGNSAMRVGIDQDVVERGLAAAGRRLRVYNFGLNSVRVDDERALVSLLLERGLKPRAVVLGVNPYLIDEQINPDTIYPWVPRTTPYLYFHRSRIRKAIRQTLSQTIRGRRLPPYSQFVEGTQTPKERKVAIRNYLAQWGSRPPTDYPMIRQLPELIAFFKQHGIATHVVVLPMNAAGTDVNMLYRPVMDAIRAQLPPGTLDLADAYPDECFKDIGHLNGAGRARLSADVLAWLQTKKDL
jgi:hypothetical protein